MTAVQRHRASGEDESKIQTRAVTDRRTVDPRAEASSDPVVSISGVGVAYDDQAVVADASLDIARGEIISLLGPSGCGKTTLLRSIAGLTRLDSGTIRLSGRLVSAPDVHLAPERRQVGMVFQDGALFPHLTVGQNVHFGLRGRDDADARVAEVLELTDMARFIDRMPGTLSGGQQQRVALARALAPQPEVLLLDEPFSALDAGLRVQLRREVRDILHEVGITSIVVTHDQDEAFAIGDRVGVMNDGRLLQVGTPAELYQQPTHPWVASFVGEANELVGTYSNGHVTTVVGDLPVSISPDTGSLVRVVVRPEQLEVVAGETAIVASVEYYGHDTRYEIVNGPDRIGVRALYPQFEVDDLVDVRFNGRRVPAWLEADL